MIEENSTPTLKEICTKYIVNKYSIFKTQLNTIPEELQEDIVVGVLKSRIKFWYPGLNLEKNYYPDNWKDCKL